MKKILASVLLLIALLAVGCDYQPPPGGTDDYCYRIEAKSSGNTLVGYTNTPPIWFADGTLFVEDVWLSWDCTGMCQMPSRFDRLAQRLSLSQELWDSRGSKNLCERPVN